MRRKWQPTSCLENSMDRRAWRATVHVVARVKHDWATNKTLKYIFEGPTETFREKKDTLRYFGSKRNLKRNTSYLE